VFVAVSKPQPSPSSTTAMVSVCGTSAEYEIRGSQRSQTITRWRASDSGFRTSNCIPSDVHQLFCPCAERTNIGGCSHGAASARDDNTTCQLGEIQLAKNTLLPATASCWKMSWQKGDALVGGDKRGCKNNLSRRELKPGLER
jgi:hypothetical protein